MKGGLKVQFSPRALSNVETISERGSALILTIMLMMTLSLFALQQLAQPLGTALAQFRSEQHYLQAWEQAVSSLNWGLSTTWAQPVEQQWQCLQLSISASAADQQQKQTLNVCLQSIHSRYLLRAAGKIKPASPVVYLYQWVDASDLGDGVIKLSPVKGGWLDFCPLKDGSGCDERQVSIG